MLATADDLTRWDEEDCWEFPSSFDYELLDRDARTLHSALETELGRSLGFADGGSNQDASFCWAIFLQSRQQGATLVVQNSLRISNYGKLVAVTDSKYEGTMECERVFDVCSKFGYSPVISDLLDRKYDGINGENFPNWWIRFFDWI